MTSDNIGLYQRYRKLISNYPVLIRFKDELSWGDLTSDQIKGLVREWRAYWYLKARFPSWEIDISKPSDDNKGIDIVAFTPSGRLRCIQVGGDYMKHKMSKTDYYMQVTDNKIYLRKGGV